MSDNTPNNGELNVTPPAPELTIVDLQNLRQVVDIAARRGAFSAAEMTAVGGVYSKLDTFLNAVAPAAAPAEQSADQPAA